MIRLYRYLRPFAVSVALVLILVFGQTQADLNLPNLMSDIVDKGIAKGDIPMIWKTGGIMLLVALAGGICAVLAGYLSARVAAGFGRDLRARVFSHVEQFSLSEFDKLGTASLITRTTNDITQVQMVTLFMMRMVVMAPMMAIGGVIMAVSKDARLSWILVAVLPLIAAVMIFAATKGLPLFKAMQLKLDRLNLVLREGLTGIRVVRAFNRIDHEQARFNAANLDLTSTAIAVNKIMALVMPMMMLILNLTTVAIVWIGGHRIDSGSIQVGDLMAFIQYAMQILFSVLMVSIVFVMIPRASASAERINQVLDTVPSIVDTPAATGAAVDSASSGQRGRIEFRDVTFSYPGAEQPALSHVSFTAGPGEVTAVIGGTGSGKSTLISLIPRFYDIDSGAILIDDIDIRELPQEQLRAKIGLVPQKAVLFSGTIADNIRYGKPDASDEEVRRAAETAQAMDFISELKDGFDHLIAQGGTNVSGGQKQRLSIARALVRRPEIYIFDDSFSALDFRTDARLRAALRKEIQDASVLIVAQRVSTVMDADRIIVLDEGSVVGIGTHRELMRTCEVYREIVSSQLSEEEIA
ncbi:MAG: ABC transporter ATP-binding protein [Chloroflexota bacterium]